MDGVFHHLRFGAREIAMPGQTLSLMKNKGLMLLLLVNKDPELVQKKFSVALYHTLFNEFFGSKGEIERKDEMISVIIIIL